MSRYSSIFNNPLLLGFDELERVMDGLAKSGSGYPPYNIEQCSDNHLRITLAVAGFTMNDLNVTTEDRQLVIRGRQEPDNEQTIYLHKGIAKRQFQRAFVLSDDIEVEGAHMDNGLLHIDLVRIIPDKEIKQINITSSTDKKETLEIDGEAQKSDN